MSTLEVHGWTAQPRSVPTFLGDTNALPAPKPQRVDEIPLPSSALATAVLEYAKRELREETFNHSMRVYYYGTVPRIPPKPLNRPQNQKQPTTPTTNRGHPPTGIAMQTHLTPTHALPVSAETYLLTCLLHDIGTTDTNMAATRMSFEFHGGYVALELLKKELGAPTAQAESVAEAVIRHQDLGESGKISSVGLLIQLATVFGEFECLRLLGEGDGGLADTCELIGTQTTWAVMRSWCTGGRLRMW